MEDSVKVNAVSLPGAAGRGQLELWRGDLLKLVRKQGADVMVVSAHAGDISRIANVQDPPRNFLWGQLLHEGLNLRELRDSAALDLDGALGLWVSEPGDWLGAKRLLCLQRLGRDEAGLAQTFANVFAGLSVLDALGDHVHTVAMPLLGTGGFRRDPADVSRTLITACQAALGRIPGLSRIMVVVREGAAMRVLSEAFDEQLGRPRRGLEDSRLYPLIRQDLLTLASRAVQRGLAEHVFEELFDVVSQEQPSTALLASMGRKVAEHLAVHFGGRGRSLAEQIEDLRNRGVPRWIVGYLHVLRQLGNEVVHYQAAPSHRLTPDDLATAVVCLMRVLDFATSPAADDDQQDA